LHSLSPGATCSTRPTSFRQAVLPSIRRLDRPWAAALAALGDLAQLDAGLALYDALFRWCRDAAQETHNWPKGSPA